MAHMRSYGQFCSVAKALDVLGERWALLVLREIVLGPKRYTDLLAGLPGVGTNVLATRLRELETAGLITKRELPPPAPASVYELTPRGREAAPVLAALARFGAPLLGTQPGPDEDVQPSRLVLHLAATVDASALPKGFRLELLLDGDPYELAVEGGHLAPSAGPARGARTTIASPFSALFRLAMGQTSVTKFLAHKQVSVAGDRSLARTFLREASNARSQLANAVG
jgi:DNA-binding HxlR family transcriptional regulator